MHDASGPVERALGTGLIERDNEIALATAVIDAARSGSGRALLVDGPAGIGKTALLDAVVNAAGATAYPVAVMRARAAPAESAYAYGIVRQLLFRAAHRRSPLRGAAALATGALGFADAAPIEDAGAVHHGLYWLCAEMAEQAPVLLVIDDGQWADMPSLSWLAYLGRRLDELPVSLIVSWRASAPTPSWGTRDELLRSPAVRSVALQPLSADGVARLVRRQMGSMPSPRFVQDCSEFTGGNPFYIVEVTRALRARGADVGGADSVALLETSAPQLVTAEITRRVAEVGAHGHALAEAVAVLDVHADLQHAAALAGLNTADALRAMDELVAALLVDAAPRLRLCHPIIQRVVYDQIPPGRKALLHRAAADELAPDRAVGHLLRCQPAGDQEVARRLLDAASRDLATGAVESARMLLDRALREPATECRAQVLLAMGRAGRLLGDRAALAELREAQRTALDVQIQEEALLEQALLVGLDDRPADALRLLDRTIALHPPEDERAVRHLLGLRSAYALTHDDLARRAGDLAEYVRGLPQSGPLPAEQAALFAVAAAQSTLATRGTAEQAAGWAAHAIDSGGLDESGARELIYGWAVRALTWADEGKRARGIVARNVDRAISRGWRDGHATALAWAAFLDYWDGEVMTARPNAHAAIDLSAPGAFGADFATAIAGLVELEVAGPAAASDLLARRPAPSATSSGLLLRWSRCLAFLGAGQLARAEAEAEAIVDAGRRRGGIALGPRTTAALVLAQAGRVDEARSLIADEIREARGWGTASHLGVALRTAALLPNAVDARDLLDESVELLRAGPRRLEYARSLFWLGAHRRRAGERAAARDLLRSALDLAISLGAGALADAATEELAASGARVHRRRTNGPESLTPSEYRVARLAAHGLTNPEIAQQLYISRGTVEGHLTHVYRKLDISSREELAAALAGSPHAVDAT